MKFEIPGKPIPQARARVSRNFFYDPLFTVKKNIQSVIKEQLPEGFKPFTEPLELEVIFYITVPKAIPKYKKEDLKAGKELPHTSTGDLDNFQKLILDCMNKLVFDDDRQIWKINAKKVWSLEGKTCFTLIPTVV